MDLFVDFYQLGIEYAGYYSQLEIFCREVVILVREVYSA